MFFQTQNKNVLPISYFKELEAFDIYVCRLDIGGLLEESNSVVSPYWIPPELINHPFIWLFSFLKLWTKFSPLPI